MPQKTHLLCSIRKRSILLLLPTTTWASESLLHLPSECVQFQCELRNSTQNEQTLWHSLQPSIHKLLTYPKKSPQKRSWNHHNIALAKNSFFLTFLRVRSSPVQPAIPGMLPKIRCKLKLPAILWPVSPVRYLMIAWFDDLMTSK